MTTAERLVAVYQRTLSPWLHRRGVTRCKFLPTCSDYALVAVTRYGWLRGGALAAWRVLRCGPWSRGGLDPVPEPKKR